MAGSPEGSWEERWPPLGPSLGASTRLGPERSAQAGFCPTDGRDSGRRGRGGRGEYSREPPLKSAAQSLASSYALCELLP